MADIPLAELARWIGGSYMGPTGISASHAIIDSRRAGPGSLFFALPGAATDGHFFVDDVIGAGGAAVVSRRIQGEPQILVPDVEKALLRAGAWARKRLQAPVLAISGSSGKTTTRRLLELALGSRMRVAATPGNRNNQLGLPLTLLNIPRSPDVAVLELGMNHFGELRSLCEIARPTHCVITNIGLAHVENLGSREGVARAKAELLEGTEPGGFCVMPVGEPILEQAAQSRNLRVVRVGEGGDRWLGEEEGLPVLKPEGWPVRLSIPGRHNLENALVAAAAAEQMDVDPPVALEAMRGYSGMPGRSSVIAVGGARILDESYNSNPESARACLQTLAELSPGKGVAVLGDMLELGEASLSLHREVLAFADGLGLRRIVLLGKTYPSLVGELVETEAVTAEDVVEGAELALEALRPEGAVLVKASRSLRLERVVEMLQERLSRGEGAEE